MSNKRETSVADHTKIVQFNKRRDGTEAALAEKLLAEENVKHVRLAFVDASNVLRFRLLPLTRFLQFIQTDGPIRGLCMANANLGLLSHHDELAPGIPRPICAVGEVCLVPDLGSLRKLPYGSGTHAICMGDFQEKDFLPGQTLGAPFPGCPRTCLKNVIASAQSLGINFLVGFESEVVFLAKTDPPTPIDTSNYCSSTAFHSERTWALLDEIVEGITLQGIGIQQFHAESGPGQFEFVTDPYEPLEAADALVLTRETIYNIAAKYKLKATFAPKPFLDAAGTGAHCHISIHSSSNQFEFLAKSGNGPESLSGLEESFMAGILKHMRAMTAFTLPTVASYARVQEHVWAGVYVGWGIDNREVPLRLAYAPAYDLKDREFRFEVKCVDGTSNPYLALAAIITAGLAGVRNSLPLAIKELTVSPSDLPEEDRLALGVTEKLPRSLDEALDAVRLDYDVFAGGMGSMMVDMCRSIRAGEAAHMKTLSETEYLQQLKPFPYELYPNTGLIRLFTSPINRILWGLNALGAFFCAGFIYARFYPLLTFYEFEEVNKVHFAIHPAWCAGISISLAANVAIYVGRDNFQNFINSFFRFMEAFGGQPLNNPTSSVIPANSRKADITEWLIQAFLYVPWLCFPTNFFTVFFFPSCPLFIASLLEPKWQNWWPVLLPFCLLDYLIVLCIWKMPFFLGGNLVAYTKDSAAIMAQLESQAKATPDGFTELKSIHFSTYRLMQALNNKFNVAYAPLVKTVGALALFATEVIFGVAIIKLYSYS